MFDAEDFIMPLERELKMRIIEQEINECNDVATLQQNLIECATSLMKYQHLLAQTLKKQIIAELEASTDEVYKIVKEVIEDANGRQYS